MNENDQIDSGSRPHRKPEDKAWHSWIDELIQEAQAQGAFDNLRGHGKPLPNWRNPHLPEEHQLAYDLIRNSGHTLPWLDDAREIDRRIDAVRLKLRRDHEWFQAQHQVATIQERPALQAEWNERQTRFEREVGEINRLIDTYNLKSPSTQFHKFRLILSEEYQRIGISNADE